jgi:hypothetical protein
MTSQLQVLLSYRTLLAFDQLPAAITDADTSLMPLMTVNFRMCFWRVFDRVWKIDVGETKLSVLGLPATLASVHLLEARALKGAVDGDPDYLVVATFHFDVDEETLTNARFSLRERLTSEEFVGLYERLLKPTPAGFLFDQLSSELPGHSSWVAPHTGTLETHGPYLAAYYHYGWILTLRVDRGSILMDLSTRDIANNTNTQQILTHRIQLIQLQRYFLAEDRSNNAELRKLCTRLMRDKYKLEKRFARLSDLHQAMEEHLDNTFKVLQSKTTKTTNIAIQVLTFSGLPLAIASVVLALDLASSIFKQFEDVIIDPRVYILIAVSFAVPFVVVVLAMMIDRILHPHKDLLRPSKHGGR